MANPELARLVDDNLAAVTAKDLDGALAGFAPDGVLIDPHYPVPRMQGHEAIAAGLGWVFRSMRELHFEVDGYFFAGDGSGAAAEVTSRHVLRNGRPIELRQTFVVRVSDRRIVRWQAYEPYGPHGVAGLARRLSRLAYAPGRGR